METPEHIHNFITLTEGETGCVDCSKQVITYRLGQIIQGKIEYRDFWRSLNVFDRLIFLQMRANATIKELGNWPWSALRPRKET